MRLQSKARASNVFAPAEPCSRCTRIRAASPVQTNINAVTGRPGNSSRLTIAPRTQNGMARANVTTKKFRGDLRSDVPIIMGTDCINSDQAATTTYPHSNSVRQALCVVLSSVVTQLRRRGSAPSSARGVSATSRIAPASRPWRRMLFVQVQSPPSAASMGW